MSNFLMGCTFLDIEIVRAVALLHTEQCQAEQIREVELGQWLHQT